MSDSVTTIEQIRDIIVDIIGCDGNEVKPEANLKQDLGADQIDIVEIWMAIEEDFDIEIPDDDYETLLAGTIADLVRYIHEHKQQP